MLLYKCSILISILYSTLIIETKKIEANPCSEFLNLQKVSNEFWEGDLTLISDSDLNGIWVRILTKPSLENIQVSDNFNVKYSNGTTTPDIRLSNREFQLQSGKPKIIKLKGKLADGNEPELISLTLNGKLFCASEKHMESVYFTGDFNGDYLIQNSNINIAINPVKSAPNNFENCGKFEMNSENIPSWQGELIFPGNNGKSSVHLCEATLIFKNYFLTSAHCVTWKNSRRQISKNKLKIVLKSQKFQELNIENILVHPNFKENNLMNDLALIKVDGDLDNYFPICLTNFKAGKFYVSGYGFKTNRTLTDSKILSEIRKLSDQECSALEPNFANYFNDENYCAIYTKQNEVCVGSSGSAVMNFNGNAWELSGILSVGRARFEQFKCDENSPILITDVRRYSKWIQKNT